MNFYGGGISKETTYRVNKKFQKYSNIAQSKKDAIKNAMQNIHDH